jgi:hypothetical protein
MTDAVHLAQPSPGGAGHAAGSRTTHSHQPQPAAFHQTLLHASQKHGAGGGTVQDPVHRAVARIPATTPATLPQASADALSQAMAREGVPASWQPGLEFIMARESGGQVGAQSPIHSARGLYQLTAANYHYNPKGAASFGNAVEEAQGGIRYIRARYGDAGNAAAFWHRHGWY